MLIVLALGLCGLCAWQWYGQTVQRNQMESMNQLLNQKIAAIQDYTNSIHTLDNQVAQMDAHITELKGTIKTNEDIILNQKRQMNGMEATNEVMSSEIEQYKVGVKKLEDKLKEAFDGIQKQNDAIKVLVSQRDDFVEKLNASIKERNNIVSNYNDLVLRFEKLQGDGKSASK